jgi:hypothetical protein
MNESTVNMHGSFFSMIFLVIEVLMQKNTVSSFSQRYTMEVL